MTILSAETLIYSLDLASVFVFALSGAVIAARWDIPVSLAVALPVVALALLVPLYRWWRRSVSTRPTPNP